MSKIYLIDNKFIKEENLHKVFYASNHNIKVYDLVEEINITTDYFDNVRAQRQRDEQLKGLLSDEYNDLINFKRLFNEHIKSDEEMLATIPSWDKRNSIKHIILKSFNEIGFDNLKFAKLLKTYKEYFLLKVTNDVEYFQAYLRFNNCNLSFKENKRIWVNSSLWSTSGKWVNKMVDRFIFDDETMENFKIAKTNIRNEKK